MVSARMIPLAPCLTRCRAIRNLLRTMEGTEPCTIDAMTMTHWCALLVLNDWLYVCLMRTDESLLMHTEWGWKLCGTRRLTLLLVLITRLRHNEMTCIGCNKFMSNEYCACRRFIH